MKGVNSGFDRQIAPQHTEGLYFCVEYPERKMRETQWEYQQTFDKDRKSQNHATHTQFL